MPERMSILSGPPSGYSGTILAEYPNQVRFSSQAFLRDGFLTPNGLFVRPLAAWEKVAGRFLAWVDGALLAWCLYYAIWRAATESFWRWGAAIVLVFGPLCAFNGLVKWGRVRRRELYRRRIEAGTARTSSDQHIPRTALGGAAISRGEETTLLRFPEPYGSLVLATPTYLDFKEVLAQSLGLVYVARK